MFNRLFDINWWKQQSINLIKSLICLFNKKKIVLFIQLTIFNIYRNKLKKGCLGILNQKQEVKIDNYFEKP